jgi:hypothetical protein
VDRAAVQRVVLVLKFVMDVAELRDAEMDALADLIPPKFVKRSKFDAVTFQTVVRRCTGQGGASRDAALRGRCQVCSGRRQCPGGGVYS